MRRFQNAFIEMHEEKNGIFQIVVAYETWKKMKIPGVEAIERRIYNTFEKKIKLSTPHLGISGRTRLQEGQVLSKTMPLSCN